MNEHLFIGDTTYPHDSRAAEYLRGKYGAYRGHHAWRDIEAGFNAGLTLANSNAAGRIEQLERELADGKLSRLDSECLRIGQQIHRAAGNLPEMFNIVIDIENGYGGVKLFNNVGDECDFETDSDGLSYSIEKAINAAIKEGKA